MLLPPLLAAMNFAPERLLLHALNHVVAAESWAAERLRPFAGQTLRIEGGTLALALQVDENGLFGVPEAAGEPVVTIRLPADTPWRLLTDRPSVFAAARLAGPADFTETLGFVFRHLRWDAEGDLARLVGDIPARRLSRGARQLIEWQAAASRNLASNVAEYASEEAKLLVPARDMQVFADALAGVQDELAGLERRLQKLVG